MDNPRPDFLILGAPKAGSTALHDALALHPEVFVSTPKEPKYWICDSAPPPHWIGPGDAHSQQEWVWRRDDYQALFAPAAEGQVRGESTPFYLWHSGARHRIAKHLPDAKLIVIVRDPIDRAYSNWMHLWSDGLEPERDFVRAFTLQDHRIRAGWAPFWRYRDLGLYGAQLQNLFELLDRDRVLVLRYREVVAEPIKTLDRTCEFLGIATGVLDGIPASNSRGFVAAGPQTTALGPVIRAGAKAGSWAPPQVWRAVHPQLVRLMHAAGQNDRPRLSTEQREEILPAFADDIELLQQLTGDDYGDWLSTTGRGSFRQRLAP